MSQPARQLQAVLFDFDGVIVHSEPLHCRSYIEAAAAMGVRLTESMYYQELIGFDDRGAIARLYAMAGAPLDEAVFSRFLEYKSARVRALARSSEYGTLPGVRELVAELRGRAFGMGICSGALREEIELLLEGTGLRSNFSVITAAEDVTVGKPDPRGYLLTARRLSEKMGLDLPPERCLVVEDAPTVAHRAAEAGFAVLGVTTTFERDAWPRGIRVVESLSPDAVGKVVPELHLNTGVER